MDDQSDESTIDAVSRMVELRSCSRVGLIEPSYNPLMMCLVDIGT